MKKCRWAVRRFVRDRGSRAGRRARRRSQFGHRRPARPRRPSRGGARGLQARRIRTDGGARRRRTSNDAPTTSFAARSTGGPAERAAESVGGFGDAADAARTAAPRTSTSIEEPTRARETRLAAGARPGGRPRIDAAGGDAAAGQIDRSGLEPPSLSPLSSPARRMQVQDNPAGPPRETADEAAKPSAVKSMMGKIKEALDSPTGVTVRATEPRRRRPSRSAGPARAPRAAAPCARARGTLSWR